MQFKSRPKDPTSHHEQSDGTSWIIYNQAALMWLVHTSIILVGLQLRGGGGRSRRRRSSTLCHHRGRRRLMNVKGVGWLTCSLSG